MNLSIELALLKFSLSKLSKTDSKQIVRQWVLHLLSTCMLSPSGDSWCFWLFATPWNIARQAPLSMEFSRQEYWSSLPFPTPGDLPDPGIEPQSLALADRFFTTSTTWEACKIFCLLSRIHTLRYPIGMVIRITKIPGLIFLKNTFFLKNPKFVFLNKLNHKLLSELLFSFFSFTFFPWNASLNGCILNCAKY